MKPIKGTYPAYLDNYIPLVRETSILEALKNDWSRVSTTFSSLGAGMENLSYAEGKWTVKQLLCHMIDTERVFSYRAMRFARRDPQMNLSFDENQYVANANLNHRHLGDLLLEFEAVRKATIALFAGFDESDLMQKGMLTLGETTVLALGYAICGHSAHHLHVLKDRYIKNNSSIKI